MFILYVFLIEIVDILLLILMLILLIIIVNKNNFFFIKNNIIKIVKFHFLSTCYNYFLLVKL